MIFFFDTEENKLIFYENDVRKDLNLTDEDGSYYVKVGSGKDAFFARVNDALYMYYNGRLKNIKAYEWYPKWISATAKSMVYIYEKKVWLYDAVTDETWYVCDEKTEDGSDSIGYLYFSPDGRTIVYSPYSYKYGEYNQVWIFSNGELRMADDSSIPLAVTNNGEELFVYEYAPWKRKNKIIKKDGTEIYLEDGEFDRFNFMNNDGSEFIFSIVHETDLKKNQFYHTFLYQNGEVIKVADDVLSYLGKDEDRDSTAPLNEWDIYIYAEPYISDKETLFDSYFLLRNGRENIRKYVAYMDKNKNVEIVVDRDIYYGFAATYNGRYLYYGDWEDRNVYCMKNGKESIIATNCKDIDNYKGKGAYILADYDGKISSGTLYYCDDGRNLQMVMEGVRNINVEGNYVYIMVWTGKNLYDVYRGNPKEGYTKIEENVKYEVVTDMF